MHSRRAATPLPMPRSTRSAGFAKSSTVILSRDRGRVSGFADAATGLDAASAPSVPGVFTADSLPARVGQLAAALVKVPVVLHVLPAIPIGRASSPCHGTAPHSSAPVPRTSPVRSPRIFRPSTDGPIPGKRVIHSYNSPAAVVVVPEMWIAPRPPCPAPGPVPPRPEPVPLAVEVVAAERVGVNVLVGVGVASVAGWRQDWSGFLALRASHRHRRSVLPAAAATPVPRIRCDLMSRRSGRPVRWTHRAKHGRSTRKQRTSPPMQRKGRRLIRGR